MVRGTSSFIASRLPTYNTFVYSISRLSIQQSIKQAKTVFSNHSCGDIAMLQVGTPDIVSSSTEELVIKYTELIRTVKNVAPKTQIIITSVPHRLSAGSLDLNKKADYLNEFLKSQSASDPLLLFLDANPPNGSTILSF